ncbi:MAG: hypothetical protein KKF41_16530 [Actinobacteria bacterium]|nr:hypothetical protein [Actinomycetota bacterium]MBU1944634.1 hypothetical protein [Actinomycetota bacterium]MBU2689186.1 hypothetical protein [Actinomycetota bacterium]
MDAQAAVADKKELGMGELYVFIPLSLLSFAVLSLLCALGISHEGSFVALYTLGMTVFAALAMALIALLVFLTNGEVRASGVGAAVASVSRGYLMMLPFMLLALFAELALGWQAALVFTQAGIMVCGGWSASEVARGGSGKLRHLVVPIGGSFLFSILWMALSWAAQRGA